ncbi:MAG: DUF2845 domain-containing protein [Lysobacterales bacterium]|nr:MAG: DUF2845 domain-containing protein [Xanthomonadales bacterium]
MPSKTLRVAIAALFALAAAAPAHAFRCGSRIITTGDHADKILRYCGEPASVQVRVLQLPYVRDWRPYPKIIEEVVVEEWIFNRGPQQLMRSVRLENGFVTEIKSLGYGY